MTYFFSWIWAMMVESFAVLFSILLRPLGFFKNQSRPLGDLHGTPILLIHGYLHNSSAWFFLEKALAHLHIGPVYTLNLGFPFRSIEAYASIVQKKAEEIAEQTGNRDLILIGHSMGGLVASQYATTRRHAHGKLNVITIGSPLQGTHAAWIALGPNGKQMRPNSTFTQALQQAIKAATDTDFYHIGSSTDQLILPASSAFPGNAPHREYKLSGIGHISLLFSRKVLLQIKTWLC
jgi:pimeloyl-ACP methyl ester carboxylesterase